MVKYNNTDIPEDKFAEVTIGNNGIRIVQNEEEKIVGANLSQCKSVSIYLRAEDIVEIFAKFIAGYSHSDEIETVYLDDVVDDKDNDTIIDASY